MMHPASTIRRASIMLACAALFTACGGGDEGPFVDEMEPSPSRLSTTMTVASATVAVLNDAYGSGDVLLNNVTKVNPNRRRPGNLPLSLQWAASGGQ